VTARDLLANATPRPWFVVGLPWNAREPWINAGSEDPHGGRYVCEFDSNSIADMGDENLAADAALIVESVNERDPMLDLEEAWRAEVARFPARHLTGTSVQRAIHFAICPMCRALARLDAIRGETT
jgi:hypothetical protein